MATTRKKNSFICSCNCCLLDEELFSTHKNVCLHNNAIILVCMFRLGMAIFRLIAKSEAGAYTVHRIPYIHTHPTPERGQCRVQTHKNA